MSASKKEQECIALLRQRYAALLSAGEDRYPRRSDFSAEEVVAVKACFGPWPRALEAAGLKEADPEKAEKRVQKRIRAKIKIRNYRKEGKKK